MSKTTAELPFTELAERAAQIARLEQDDSRVRGAVNDVYVRELPRKEDWSFLIVSSALTCADEYRTGNAAVVNTLGTVFTLSSDTAIDGTFTGRKIKFATNPNVYVITSAAGTTGGTFTPPLSGTANIRSSAYSIFKDTYSLPLDFDRFPKNGGLLLYQGGRITAIPEVAVQNYYADYRPSPTTPEKCRLVMVGTDSLPQVELTPPPNDPYVLGYEYLRKLVPLRESTAGFAAITAGGTAVSGSGGTTRFTEATSGWYFRIDAFGTGEESEWYRVASVTHNSSLTLAVAFGLSGATSAAYTLCAAPQMPAKMHAALLYGAVINLMADQNDPNAQLYQQKFSEVVVEARKLYKTRIYSQPIESVFEDYNYRR